MEYREFKLKGDITQLQYVTFRTGLQEMKPAAWENVQDLPIELFYNVLVKAAVQAGWVEDVVEENKYEEMTTWEWSLDYVDTIPAGLKPISDWGGEVFERWVEIKSLDPN
jgi:hypothetical protein